MRLAYSCALLIASLLMLFIMTVLGVELFPEGLVNGQASLKNATRNPNFDFPLRGEDEAGRGGGLIMRTKFANFPI